MWNWYYNVSQDRYKDTAIIYLARVQLLTIF